MLVNRLVLVAYVAVLAPLAFAGFRLARARRFKYHQYAMMTVTLFNWLLAFFIMSVSFKKHVVPALPSELAQPVFLTPTVHAFVGGISQFLATYLIVRMLGEERLPKFLVIKNFKLLMRLTLALWCLAMVLGIVTYVVWYVA